MGAIYILRRVIERFREKKGDLYLIFINFEKAYNKIPREVIWRVLDKKHVHKYYINVIKDMHVGAVGS